MKNKRRFPPSVRKQAFKLWKQKDGNFTAVSQYEGMPSVPTLIKWSEEDDWEGRLEKAKELVKEVLLESGDPQLEEIVKNDAFFMTIVAALQNLTLKSLKSRRNKVMPRTPNELVQMLKFIMESQDKYLPKRKPDAAPSTATVKKVLAELLGEDEEGQRIARNVTRDLRSRLRLIKGRLEGNEDETAAS